VKGFEGSSVPALLAKAVPKKAPTVRAVIPNLAIIFIFCFFFASALLRSHKLETAYRSKPSRKVHIYCSVPKYEGRSSKTPALFITMFEVVYFRRSRSLPCLCNQRRWSCNRLGPCNRFGLCTRKHSDGDAQKNKQSKASQRGLKLRYTRMLLSHYLLTNRFLFIGAKLTARYSQRIGKSKF
jgi:hypothetical protein